MIEKLFKPLVLILILSHTMCYLFLDCTFSAFIKRSSQIPKQLTPEKQTSTSMATPTYKLVQSTSMNSPVKAVVTSPTAVHTAKTFDSTMTTAGGNPNKAHQQTWPVFIPSEKPGDIQTSNSAHQQTVLVDTTGAIHPAMMKSRHVSPPETGGLSVSSRVQTVASSNQRLHNTNTVAICSPKTNLTSPKTSANSRKFEQGSQGQVSQSDIFSDSGGMADPAKQTMNRDPEYTVPFIGKPRAAHNTTVETALSNGPGTMSNGRGATYGIGTTVHSSYQSNDKVTSLPWSVINGGRSMTYEVQALPNTPLTSVISPRTQQGVCVCV